MSEFIVKNKSRGRGSSRLGKRTPVLEQLETRELLAVVTVNAAETVRPVDTQIEGVNIALWDGDLNTTETQQLVESAGLNMFRLPGGSDADTFHFNSPPSYTGQGTAATMAEFIASVNGQGLVTLDYGSGSPQEAAAFLAYLDASVGNTTPIGMGEEWNNSTNTWQEVNWQTAGYWASLRAATPLATDDGLNFLRIDQSAPFGFQDFEVGNEIYGNWETDYHGQGGDTGAPHDPSTYIAFAKQFATYAANIDPSILIGLDVGQPTGGSENDEVNNWTSEILQQSASQGFTPGFLSDHSYMQSPGSESDVNLLLDTVTDTTSTDPADPLDWSVRAADYEALLRQYLGSAGNTVELMATEFNSVSYNPGKQTPSLVNGLFVADSLGALLESPYDSADVWDLYNGWETSTNDSSSLYGWRQGGDYGLLGSSGGPSPPSSGAYIPYPTYFAEELASKIIQAGGNVVQATSNDPELSAYAVLEPNGDLDLMVINKSATSALTGQFNLASFQPSTQTEVWQYGEVQDTAQSESSTGASALANFTTTLSLSGSDFSYSFPAYSMSVLVLGTAGSSVSGPTITVAAASNPNPVIGTTANLSVTATDTAGASSLTYTWVAIGTIPAPVSFSDNGDDTASSTTAIFGAVGTYTFQVTVADPGGLTATSAVTVTVDATLTSIYIIPDLPIVLVGGTDAFTAMARDQFEALMPTPPAFSWSVISGGGTIGSSTGLYSAPSSTGIATVQASSGGLVGTARIIITTPISRGPLATVTYTNLSDSGKKFAGAITITDTGSQPIVGWSLQFDFPHRLRNVSNAKIISHIGSQYTFDGVKSDATIASGQSVRFRFKGTPGHAFMGPTNIVLNGLPLGGIEASGRTLIVRVERPRRGLDVRSHQYLC